MNWIKTADELPPPKPTWTHSERVLVHYPATGNQIDAYSVAYYHYDSPFEGQMWIDWGSGQGRTPDYWLPIEPPGEAE